MLRFIYTATAALFIGNTALAQAGASLREVGLEQRITTLSADDGDHAFELGALTALRAIEKTLQTRYEYGLSNRLGALPLMRLPVGPVNQNAKRLQADTLTQMFKTALQNLDVARGYLNDATAKGVITPFELTLQDVWFDINANGTRDEQEAALAALGPLLFGRGTINDLGSGGQFKAPITVRFDVADHAWLLAYTHMLSGAGNLYLAFDPTPVLKQLNAGRADLAFAPVIPNSFDVDALQVEVDRLKELQTDIKTAVEPLQVGRNESRKKLRELMKAPKADRDEAQIKEFNDRSKQLRHLNQQQRVIRAEIRAAEAKIKGPQPGFGVRYSKEIDTVYTVLAALRQQPDGAKIAQARDHWRAMIAQNGVFWAALDLETDNEKEWIPNARQTSALPVVIDEGVAAAWQAILTDAAAVLEGRLLVPHPLLPQGYGINIAAYVNDPSPLNVLDWAHGIGAYPYASKGPIITRQRWLAFQRLTGGNAGGFALFFN